MFAYYYRLLHILKKLYYGLYILKIFKELKKWQQE